MAKCKYFIAGALIGSLVGAAVAVLTTPRSGREMREELGKNLEFTKEKGKDFYHALMERIEPAEPDQTKSDQLDGWMELPVRMEDQAEKQEKEKQEISL
ncbi:YtxH domain-containing protein [Thermoactinomyces mirandus]|uniref:YtxH domain-containing protein n=1 Tax=Thermoactinomyces mirandus TaxID=2756294 RepID=A0A7W2ARF4_9BACL|nr:YtxH domain-containing protein [Thermoactinomyces mirandus]MBA4601476.1 YtxH domain-containing protein [Thermoactinomyces mirandus]